MALVLLSSPHMVYPLARPLRRRELGGLLLSTSALPAAGYAELPTPLSGLASGPKTVLFVRHGQSTANAATDKKRPQDPLFLDAPLTERGRTQASSWRDVAPSWGIESIYASPLIRATETAARVFENCDMPICITPYARESSWWQTENRGRLAAGIERGTLNGRPGEKQLWPVPREMPGSPQLLGLQELQRPSRFWNPDAERKAAAAGRESVLEMDWSRTLTLLCEQIAAAPASRLAVVAHSDVMHALLGEKPRNCQMVETQWSLDAATGRIRIARISNRLPPSEVA